MRFRQGDWFHRGCAFLQLVIFSAMAAFTNNFDITNGIQDTSAEDALKANLTALTLNATSSDIQAQNIRDSRLPILNARGISLVMACSRLLMLVQYCIGSCLITSPLTSL